MGGGNALEARTRRFAVGGIRLFGQLEPFRSVRDAIGQLTSATGSVAANHRAMRRARSRREFAAKLQIVVEEADEAVLWLEIIDQVLPGRPDVQTLLAEAAELRAIFVTARRTTRNSS